MIHRRRVRPFRNPVRGDGDGRGLLRCPTVWEASQGRYHDPSGRRRHEAIEESRGAARIASARTGSDMRTAGCWLDRCGTRQEADAVANRSEARYRAGSRAWLVDLSPRQGEVWRRHRGRRCVSPVWYGRWWWRIGRCPTRNWTGGCATGCRAPDVGVEMRMTEATSIWYRTRTSGMSAGAPTLSVVWTG